MKRIICLVLSLLILLSTTSFVLADEEKYVYRKSTYDFSLLTTDPMYISDEEFFGTYDKKGREIIPSYFRYD